MPFDNDFYEKLNSQLDQFVTFPSVYLFKLIIPGNHRDLAKLQHIFSNPSRFFTRDSSSGNYISVTVEEMMMSKEEVIEKYRQIGEIEGIIVL